MNISKSILLLIVLTGLLVVSGCSQNLSTGATSPRVEPLRVGVSVNGVPFAFKKDSRLQGMEVDFARQLSAYLDRPLKFIERPWTDLIPSLEKNSIDIIMSGMTITKKRSFRVAFTKPYMRSGQMLLTRTTDARKYSQGIFSLMGTKPMIGTIENTTGDFFIVKTINNPQKQTFKTTNRAIRALSKGKIDVFVHDAPIICYAATMNEGAGLTPIRQLASEEYLGWAVNRENKTLLMQVNSFLKDTKQREEMKSVVKRWVPCIQSSFLMSAE